MLEIESMLAEAERQFTVCNACRYCEGYCAVFPAMQLHTELSIGDAAYLANLCHDCRACFQACPYTPPHEFAVNIPALMSEMRVASYHRYARPRQLASLFTRGSWAFLLTVLGVTASFIVLFAAISSLNSLTTDRSGAGSFYDVVPFVVMLVPALILTTCAICVVGVGVTLFLRETRPGGIGGSRFQHVTSAAADIVTLRWMRGGGGGCHYPDAERSNPYRRVLHQTVAAGFVLAFAATLAAALEQEVLGRTPPFPVVSAPVILGTAGGVLLIIGTAGLTALKRRSQRDLSTASAVTMEYGLLSSLFTVAATGIGLLIARETRAMGPLLLLHLASVAVLFVSMPYGKFVHAGYRAAALFRYRAEASKSERQ